MAVSQPTENEYQRVLNVANRNKAQLAALIDERKTWNRGIFRDLPFYRLTSITEWGACLYAKTGEIKAKSWSGLVTYATNHPILDWDWLQVARPDWLCCPQCGRWFPKEARYWWVRNRERGYFWTDACRDCKCQTNQRWGERKRARLVKSSCSVQ